MNTQQQHAEVTFSRPRSGNDAMVSRSSVVDIRLNGEVVGILKGIWFGHYNHGWKVRTYKGFDAVAALNGQEVGTMANGKKVVRDYLSANPVKRVEKPKAKPAIVRRKESITISYSTQYDGRIRVETQNEVVGRIALYKGDDQNCSWESVEVTFSFLKELEKLCLIPVDCMKERMIDLLKQRYSSVTVVESEPEPDPEPESMTITPSRLVSMSDEEKNRPGGSMVSFGRATLNVLKETKVEVRLAGAEVGWITGKHPGYGETKHWKFWSKHKAVLKAVGYIDRYHHYVSLPAAKHFITEALKVTNLIELDLMHLKKRGLAAQPAAGEEPAKQEEVAEVEQPAAAGATIERPTVILPVFCSRQQPAATAAPAPKYRPGSGRVHSEQVALYLTGNV